MIKVFCPKCRETIQEDDNVILDFINTITHTSCYTESYEVIADQGTYKELVEKYTFLQEFVH